MKQHNRGGSHTGTTEYCKVNFVNISTFTIRDDHFLSCTVEENYSCPSILSAISSDTYFEGGSHHSQNPKLTNAEANELFKFPWQESGLPQYQSSPSAGDALFEAVQTAPVHANNSQVNACADL